MKILIVDDQVDIVDLIGLASEDILPNVEKVYNAYSGNQAIEVLKNEEIDLIICDHNMPDGNGNIVLDYIIQENKQTKFVLCSTITPKDMPDFYNKTELYFNIVKPEILEGLQRLSEKVQNIVKEDPKGDKEHYIPISLRLLKLLRQAPSNLYIKLSMDKYVKVINEYEILTDTELNKYSNKELKLLYVQKNTIQFDQDFFNKVILKIFNNDTISFSDKIMTSHEQVSQLLKNIGVTEDLANLTKESVELTTKLLEKNDKLSNYFQKLNNMGDYPSKLYTLQTMIGSSLLRKMTWTSQQTMYKLTLASFLQAIYLDNVELIAVKNYKDLLSKHFSQRDIEFFKEHPIKTKNILLNFKDIPPDIDKLILEQYESPTGDGFPKKIGATSISPLSAIFILAGIISKYILDNPKEFAYERMMNELDNQGYSKGNFKEIYKKIPIIFNN